MNKREKLKVSGLIRRHVFGICASGGNLTEFVEDENGNKGGINIDNVTKKLADSYETAVESKFITPERFDELSLSSNDFNKILLLHLVSDDIENNDLIALFHMIRLLENGVYDIPLISFLTVAYCDSKEFDFAHQLKDFLQDPYKYKGKRTRGKSLRYTNSSQVPANNALYCILDSVDKDKRGIYKWHSYLDFLNIKYIENGIGVTSMSATNPDYPHIKNSNHNVIDYADLDTIISASRDYAHIGNASSTFTTACAIECLYLPHKDIRGFIDSIPDKLIADDSVNLVTLARHDFCGVSHLSNRLIITEEQKKELEKKRVSLAKGFYDRLTKNSDKRHDALPQQSVAQLLPYRLFEEHPDEVERVCQEVASGINSFTLYGLGFHVEEDREIIAVLYELCDREVDLFIKSVIAVNNCGVRCSVSNIDTIHKLVLSGVDSVTIENVTGEENDSIGVANHGDVIINYDNVGKSKVSYIYIGKYQHIMSENCLTDDGINADIMCVNAIESFGPLYGYPTQHRINYSRKIEPSMVLEKNV